MTGNEPEFPRRRYRPPPLGARLMRMFGVLFVLAAGFLIGGFFIFLSTIPRAEPRFNVSGDSILALTGGPARLTDALHPLANGRGKRLLISGVNRDTTRAQLAQLYPDSRLWLDCCVDLGRRALNTAGNAVETRQWVRKHGFQSVIVVTSGWHMRRALLELQRSIPEVTLVPYPVEAGTTAAEAWWTDPRTLRLLTAEYIKYLAALVEVRIAPRVADEDPAENPQK